MPPESGKTIWLKTERVEHPKLERSLDLLMDRAGNVHSFMSIDHAKEKIKSWRRDYNLELLHGSQDFVNI